MNKLIIRLDVDYDGYFRHILSDKSAPFKPCGFSLDPQSGNKCIKPAPFYARGDRYVLSFKKNAVFRTMNGILVFDIVLRQIKESDDQKLLKRPLLNQKLIIKAFFETFKKTIRTENP